MTKHPRVTVILTKPELIVLRSEASDGESDSNLVRRKLQLVPLAHGGRRKSPKSKHLAPTKK